MKKIIIIVILFLLVITTSASNNKFIIKDVSFNKEEEIISKFPREYSLAYKIKYQDLDKDIIELSKKVTYLLLGPSESIESNEDYYKRHKDYLNMRYKPVIPTKNGKIDTNSQEYKDELVSSFTVSTIFNKINELDINYSTFGDITVSKSNDLILSTVVLPSVTMKKEDSLDSTKYNTIHTNLVIYYFFKENNNDYQLYYLVADSKDDIDEYLSYINENGSKNKVNIAKDYSYTLNNLYKVTDLNKVSSNTINNLYESNKDKIVKLISFYKDGSSMIGNGIFIDKGLIITTWDYLKKSLTETEYINVIYNNKSYDIDGIVTINKDSNIVVIKLKDQVSSGVKLANNYTIGETVISISNKAIGYKANKGLLVTDNGYLQSTIPVSISDSGSPLFNTKGEVIGLTTTLLTNSPSSFSIPYLALSEVKDKFTMAFNEIKTISFDELKKSYYVSYGNEEIEDTLSSSKWKEINDLFDISNNIHMKIVKTTSHQGMVSIRYKNNTNNTRPMKMAESFKNYLLNNGYKESLYSDKKCIYEKDNYQVMMIEEFNYLIVIMVI